MTWEAAENDPSTRASAAMWETQMKLLAVAWPRTKGWKFLSPLSLPFSLSATALQINNFFKETLLS